MIIDLTPVMGDEDREQAEELSLAGARPPVSVPGYSPECFLGRGAYGEVWVARDGNTDVRVAIKFFTQRSGSDWSLLAREVDKLRSLAADRYVVQLLKVGWDATPPYYVMEYLERGSLEDRLGDGCLPAAEAVPLFREIANAVLHAHAKGILHCDLKPANILLDQDDKPRLADFGQSRLASEQSPALGTLFYMAPEQADTEAVPDARWDVYALGAIFFRVLMGRPPYHSDQKVTAIRQEAKLKQRLAAYRKLIESSPQPTEHRRMSGVDGRLADIIERCLCVKPGRRFATAQAVLDALDARAVARARRPLLVVGALGPVLLFVIMAFLAFRAVAGTFRNSNEDMLSRVQDGNRFAAHFLAQAVARQLDRRLRVIEQVASEEYFRNLVREAAGKPLADPARQKLQRQMDHLWGEHQAATSARTWFCDSASGECKRLALAADPHDPDLNGIRTRGLDHSFAHRTYFHGGKHDLKEGEKPLPPPLTESFISPVFLAKTTRELTVVFSTPVWSADRDADMAQSKATVLGVLGISLRLGQLESGGASDGEAKKWALVDLDGGIDGKSGTFLQHSSQRATEADFTNCRWPPELTEREGRLIQPPHAHRGANLREDLLPAYQDPIGAVDPDFDGDWLAAVAPVRIVESPNRPHFCNPPWLVVVQERKNRSVAPLAELIKPLVKYGAWAVVLAIAAYAALWFFVFLEQSPSSRLTKLLRRRAGVPIGNSSGRSSSSNSVAPSPSSGR
jgi:hypothetical protein